MFRGYLNKVSKTASLTRRAHSQASYESRWWQMEQPKLSETMRKALYDKHLENEFLAEERRMKNNEKQGAKKKENEFVIWDGLQQLFDLKEFQGIKQYPSDIVWINKNKNLYLLEICKMIENSEWREWLLNCSKMVEIDENNINNSKEQRSIYYDISRNGEFPYPQQKKRLFIKSNNEKNNENKISNLVLFVISKLERMDKMDKKSILKVTQSKSVDEMIQLLESEKIFDCICKADLNLSTHKRNVYLTMKGNGSLLNCMTFDKKFSIEWIKYFIKLYDIDKNLCQLLIECLKNDIGFNMLINNTTHESGNGIFNVAIEKDSLNRLLSSYETIESNDDKEQSISRTSTMYLWDDEKGKIVEYDPNGMNGASNKAEAEAEVEDEGELDVPEGHWSVVHDSLRQYINRVPSMYRGISDLLRHSMEDVNKLVPLDSSRLGEGYSGDNSNPKWGLWRGNNLPIICLRPHLLEIRDLILSNQFGKYIEIDGRYGSGKSVALMYAVSVARSNNWLTIYCPDSYKWVQQCTLTVPANDRKSVFYQHSYARQFLSNLFSNERKKLSQIELSQERINYYKNNYGIKNGDNKINRISMDTVMQMLDDPIDIKRHESHIISEWMTMGSGNHGFGWYILNKNDVITLYDMIEFGCNEKECLYPGSLMYDVMWEICNQKMYKYLIACDGINFWNNLIFGLSTPRNGKVYAWQLSMIDIFSQFQENNISLMSNGMSIMAKTTSGNCRSTGQFKTRPDYSIFCPHCYTPDEFDTMMIHYQALGLSSPKVAPDDYKKIEGASARNPLHMQRLASLF